MEKQSQNPQSILMDKNLKLELTGNIVSAYVGNNPVAQSDVSNLVRSVAAAVESLGSSQAAVDDGNYELFTSIKKSVKADHLVCLDCGKKFKTIKRHIRASHGLSVEEYKKRYSLPADYPVVAPEYAAKRTLIAVGIGLGRKR